MYDFDQFCRMFREACHGSMHGSSPMVFTVWAYCLDCADPEGYVTVKPKRLAACFAKVTAEMVQEALDYLTTPGRRTLPEGKQLDPDDDGRWLRPLGRRRYRVCKDYGVDV